MTAIKHAFLAAKQKFLLAQKKKMLKSNDTEALEMVDKELTAVTKKLDKLRDSEALLVKGSRLALSKGIDALKGGVPRPDPIYDKRRNFIKDVEPTRYKNNPFAREFALLTLPVAFARDFAKDWKQYKKEKKKYKDQRDELQPVFDAIDNAVNIEIRRHGDEVAIRVNQKQLLLYFVGKAILIRTCSKLLTFDISSEKLKWEIIAKLKQKKADLAKQSEKDAIMYLKEYTK